MTAACQQIASRSRAAGAARKQHARRQRELAARRCTVRAYQSVRTCGDSAQHAAERLGVPLRTLSHWQSRGDTCLPRGRHCKESPLESRLEVLEFLREQGPLVGLPALRLVFPEIPRCELIDLQRDYRRQFVLNHQLTVEQLTWSRPRAVWAIDHCEHSVDGRYSAILAVRDLASGMQLAWSAVPDQTAETTVLFFQQLVHQHGAPLVLKSDNGSAFKSEQFQQLLAEASIIWLPSPAYRPEYNGSCEAGIGSLARRTIVHAAHQGRVAWTSDDLEAARCEANELTCIEPGLQTHRALWEERRAVLDEERSRLRELAARHEHSIRSELTSSADIISETLRSYLHREAIRRALVECGMLSITRRSITLPLTRKNLAKIS